VHAEYHPRWHPLLVAEERTPAVWTLVDEYGQSYAVVRLERGGGGLGYTAELAHHDDEHAHYVGRYGSLRRAVEAAHRAWVRSHAPGGAPNGGKGYVLGT
jgi:hypothetical protein